MNTAGGTWSSGAVCRMHTQMLRESAHMERCPVRATHPMPQRNAHAHQDLWHAYAILLYMYVLFGKIMDSCCAKPHAPAFAAHGRQLPDEKTLLRYGAQAAAMPRGYCSRLSCSR